MLNEDQEIWKTHPKYPWIEVSCFGDVRTKDHYIQDKKGVKKLIKGHVLKQSDNGTGYLQVGFSVNKKMIYLYVHRLVATCHIPNPNNLPEINHIDCDPTNNRRDNLEWCTHQENITYREKYGVSAREATKALSHPVFAVNPNTLEVIRFDSQNEAARQLRLSRTGVCQAVNGKLNTFGGYYFTEDENEITKEKIQEIKANMRSLCSVFAINIETSDIFLFKTQAEAARQLGVFRGNIYKVLKGTYSKTGGYWFCYADENAVEKTREKFGDKIAKKVEELINKHNN